MPREKTGNDTITIPGEREEKRPFHALIHDLIKCWQIRDRSFGKFPTTAPPTRPESHPEPRNSPNNHPGPKKFRYEKVGMC